MFNTKVFIQLFYTHTATCQELNETNIFYGNYSWPQDTEAEKIVTRPCVHQCGTLTGRNASRMCTVIGRWAETNYTQCATERTCELFTITEV